MTALPAVSYFTNASRTNAEAKQGLDDVLAFIRQLVGGNATSTLTIASDAVTPTGGSHLIETESAAASDNLSTITTTNLPDGSLLLIAPLNAAHVVTVKHNTGGAGKIALADSADFVMWGTTTWLLLKRAGTDWVEVLRSALPGADGAWTDLASAATTDLGTVRAANIRITGTTGITGFGTSPAGTRKRLRFASTLTITHNGTSLIIQGGMSVTFLANWTATACSLGGGNWLLYDICPADGAWLLGDLSPSQITANQNDYAPTGHAAAAVFRLNSDASRNITGLAGGVNGRIATFVNAGSFPIVIVDESASSTAANRFALPDGDITLNADAVIALRYDGTSSRWRLVATTALALAGRLLNVQFLTSGTTYTRTAGCTKAYVIARGGGGAGGGTDGTNVNGGGGGQGGRSEKWISPASTETYAIGAGGTGASNATGGAGGNTTFGSHVTANGGAGGIVASSGGLGGAGGGASSGSLNIPGASGILAAPNVGYSPSGGGEGAGAGRSTNGAGNAATANTGGGGGGAYSNGGGSFAGGNGGTGYIIVFEYS